MIPMYIEITCVCVCVCVCMCLFVCACVCGCMYKQGKEQGCIEGFSLWVGRMLHAEVCVPPGKCVSSFNYSNSRTLPGVSLPFKDYSLSTISIIH